MNIDPHDIPADAKVDRSKRARKVAEAIERHVAEEINKTRDAKDMAKASIGEDSISSKIMADAKDTEPGTLAHLRLCFQAAVADRAWANEHIRGMSRDEALRRAEQTTREDFAKHDDYRRG